MVLKLKVQGIDVEAAVNAVKEQLQNDPSISSPLRTAIELLLVLVTVLINTITLNSKNSSKPPSTDPNREKKKRKKSTKKPGG